MSGNSDNTFWGHVEVFRWMLIRCVAVVFGVAIVAFCFKDFVFDDIILAPCRNDFVTYDVMRKLADLLGMPGLRPSTQTIEMININLASQLMTHLSISFYVGLLVMCPYVLVEVWLFVSPALYDTERKPAVVAIIVFFFQFFMGLFISY